MRDIILPDLWDFQAESVDRLRDGMRRGVHAQMLCAPTGSGKLEIAKYMLASVARKRRRATFVVDRLSLLDQTARRFDESNIPYGILGDRNSSKGLNKDIIIAMAQSLARRGWPVDQDVIFVDEAHSLSHYLRSTLLLRGCPIIGLSATPMTRGLAKVFSTVEQVVTTDQLLEQGRLAPLRMRAQVEIDMHGAPLRAGEYMAEDIQSRGRVIIGDIVSTYAKETRKVFGGSVPTMMFSASIAHGEELCREFQSAGIDARQVTAHDNKDLRRDTMQAFIDGKFPVVCSVDALAKGIDVPNVKCLVIARPYNKALHAHLQMLGRGMRTAPDKDFVLVNDHSGNVLRFYTETADFFANGITRLDAGEKKKAEPTQKEKKERICKGCGYVLPPKVSSCPVCGLERASRKHEVINVPGTTINIDVSGTKVFTIEPVRKGRKWKGTESELWAACCADATRHFENHGDSDRARRQALAKYHDLTGEWPERHYSFLPRQYVPKTIARRLAKSYRDWKRSQHIGA